MISQHIQTFLFVQCIVFSLASRELLAQLPTIELNALSRLGGKNGTDFDMHVLAGNRTDEVDKIFFSHPGIVGQVIMESAAPFCDGDSPKFGHFRVSIAQNVKPGLYEARVQGRFGLSNSRLFWVTSEAWQPPIVAGANVATAAYLPLNEIVQDECVPRQRKFYHLSLRSEQAVKIRIATSTLDSRARLFVTLVDTLQKQVATAEVIENQDTLVEYNPTQSGTHTLIVSDHLFRGGHEYPYAIQASLVENEPPLAVNLVDEWRSQVNAMEAGEPNAFGAVPTMQLSANAATLRMPLVEKATTIHDELRFSDRQNFPIEFPSLIAGRFETNTDQDWFEFSLDAKTTAAIEIVSDRLGERTDPQLIVYRVEGPDTATEKLHQVAIADDISNVAGVDVRLASRDAVLQFTAPESGKYRLLVRDQQRSDRRFNRHRYAVELRTPVPDVTAIAYLAYPVRDASKSESIAPTIAKDGTLAVAVAITGHDGWSGSVEVQAEGLPVGVSSTGLSLAANQTNGHLILVASSDATASISPVSIRIATKGQEPCLLRTARPIELTWGAIDTQKAPVARVASAIVVAVEDRDSLPLTVKLGSSKTLSVERGSKLRIPFAFQRREGGKQSVIVRLKNAPVKAKVADVTVNADQNAGELEISIPEDALLGEYTCWAQCETKLKLQPNYQSMERSQSHLAELELMKVKIAEDQRKDIEAAIVAQQEKIKQLKESTKLQDFAVQLPSTSVQFRIVEKP